MLGGKDYVFLKLFLFSMWTECLKAKGAKLLNFYIGNYSTH